MIINRQAAALSNAPLLCYNNLVQPSVVSSAASYEAGFPVTNLATYETWQATRPITSTAWVITINWGSTQTINYIGLSGVVIAGAASLTVVDTTGFFPYANLDGVSIDSGLSLFLTDNIVAQSIILSFVNVASVGNVMLGQRTPLERNIYVGHSPANLSRDTELIGAQSANGQYLGRAIRSRSISTQVELGNITPAWYRSTFDPFVEAAQLQPFYWAWRPASYNEAIYGWLGGDVRPVNQRPNGMMSTSFSIQGRDR